ncbi:MAG: hypothetical protein AAGF88_08855 [Pseudomonadota bacterium]
MRRVLLPFIVAIWALPLPAQTVIGTAVVDGQEVEILSDNTWRFRASIPATADCVAVDGPISFCTRTSRWRALPTTPSPAVDVIFQLDDRSYAMMVIEAVGLRDGLNTAGLQQIVLSNAATAANRPPDSIPILESYDAEVDGAPYPTISFRATLQGLNFVYHVTMILQDAAAIQLTSYTIGAEIDPSQRALHEDFLASVLVRQ